MTVQFEQALAYLRERHDPADPAYLEACEVIADNLSELPYRMFIHLPGGLGGNNDPAWNKVKAASEECCSCGNERVFEPRDMRHKFEPSSAEPITLSLGSRLYIRPVGAPPSAAYAMFEVVDADGPAVTYLADPLSSSLDFTTLFKTSGFRLADLVEPLRRQNGEPAVFMRDLRHVKEVPLVSFAAVDAQAATITMVLDAAVEAFDPDAETAHTH